MLMWGLLCLMYIFKCYKRVSYLCYRHLFLHKASWVLAFLLWADIKSGGRFFFGAEDSASMIFSDNGTVFHFASVHLGGIWHREVANICGCSNKLWHRRGLEDMILSWCIDFYFSHDCFFDAVLPGGLEITAIQSCFFFGFVQTLW